jgi:hypothetical protein
MTGLALLVACLQAPTLDAEAGFQGQFFSDSWTRMSARVTYEGPKLDTELRVTVRSHLCEAVVYRRPLPLVGKTRMRVGFDVFLSSDNFVAEVELVAKDKSLARVNLPLRFQATEGARLLAVGTPPPILIEAMAKGPPVTLVRMTPELLPATTLSLQTVGSLFIPEPIDLDPGQEDALRLWVKEGGRLIFGAGRSTHLRQNPFWKSLCPLAAPEIATASFRVKEADIPLTLVRGKLLRGKATYMVGADPAVIRYPEGAGEVVFVPMVLDFDGLGKVVSAAGLLTELMQLPPPPVEEPPKPGQRFRSRPQWIDPSQQSVLNHATWEYLRQLVPSSFSLAPGPLAVGIGVAAAYLVLIGPIEYRRLRKKGRLRKGWISFAFLVVAFGGLVLAWTQWTCPRASKFVQVSLLDEHRLRTVACFRPARGGEFDLESSGPLSPLPPQRNFGAADKSEGAVVTVPSGLHLAVPPASPRLLVSSRPTAPADGSITARWATGERKGLLVKNDAPFPLQECWLVSKETVWPLDGIPAGGERAVAIKEPVPFETWASKLLLPVDTSPQWWWQHSTWEAVTQQRWGLVLTFYEQLHHTWGDKKYRRVLLERGVDLTPALTRGEVILVGSFDHNLSGLRSVPEIAAETYGWARIRVGEASR